MSMLAFVTSARPFAPYRLRRGRSSDAAEIAELANAAGDGLPMALWRSLARPGEDPLALGIARAQRRIGAYSYTRTQIAEGDHGVAGAIIDYRLGHMPEPITEATPPLVVPLNELENLVCGSWYVNILAVKPASRRQGIGRALLAAADRRAREAGCDSISLIVADENRAARRLYEAHGYRERGARRMVKTGWDGPGEYWLLLDKTL